jgi:hypothetical protein
MERESKRQRCNDTVKFNVSGQVFEVLRDPTLTLHPESLLNTLAEQHSGVENIFVDRSADLFQYMLAFHRDRKIIIPHTVPKESVLREAAVFGLPVSTNDIIQETPPLAQLGTIVSDVAEVVEESLVASKVALLSDLILKGHELLAIWPEPHVKKRRMSIA